MIAVEWQEETKQQIEEGEGVGKGRDERQKKEKELWETITQPDNYSVVRIYISFSEMKNFQSVFHHVI